MRGSSKVVATSSGDVTVNLLHRNDGRPGVGLCRNGMWITSDLPMFQNQFNDRQPFQALILLYPERRNDFYGLVQEAETPLHNDLALKLMPADRRHALRRALGEIRDWIRSEVPEAKTESYSPDDILSFQFHGTVARGPGRSSTNILGLSGDNR